MSFVMLEDAARLVKDMKILYGKDFIAQYGMHSDVDLAVRFAALLADVHIQQFEHGMKRMETSGNIPTMPKFKEWCLELKGSGQNWLSVNEAWALCLRLSNREKQANGEPIKVTVQAMKAFENVKHILQIEGQKSAFFAFKGFYNRIVESDQARGVAQATYEPPKRLPAPRDTRASDTMTKEMRAELRKRILDFSSLMKVPPKGLKENTGES